MSEFKTTDSGFCYEEMTVEEAQSRWPEAKIAVCEDGLVRVSELFSKTAKRV